MDIATIIGLAGAFAMVIMAMGDPGPFIDMPSIYIVGSAQLCCARPLKHPGVHRGHWHGHEDDQVQDRDARSTHREVGGAWHHCQEGRHDRA